MIHALSHPAGNDPAATFTNRRHMLTCPWCLRLFVLDFDLEADLRQQVVDIREREQAYQAAQTAARSKLHDLGSTHTYPMAVAAALEDIHEDSMTIKEAARRIVYGPPYEELPSGQDVDQNICSCEECGCAYCGNCSPWQCDQCGACACPECHCCDVCHGRGWVTGEGPYLGMLANCGAHGVYCETCGCCAAVDGEGDQ